MGTAAVVSREAVLIVDDSAMFRVLVRGAVESRRGMGIDVLEAASGAAAREVLSSRRVALVLLDLGMPGGGGIGFLEHLRARDRTTPVVVLSGSHDRPTIEAALRAGANAYMTKPFKLDDLWSTIARYTATPTADAVG